MSTISSTITHSVVFGTYGSPLTITSTGKVLDSATPGGTAIIAPGSYANPTLINEGTISSTHGEGVLFGNGGYVYNTGLITAASEPGVYILGAAGTVTNTGSIAGYYKGVYLTSGGTVNNYGTITASGVFSSGVSIRGGLGTVTNTGAIKNTGNYGVSLANGGSVSNSGLIQGYAFGVYIGGGAGTITNTGTIQSLGDSYFWGIRLYAGGTITNTNSIRGGYGVQVLGGLGVVANSGTITTTNSYHSGIDLVAGGTVINSGTISNPGGLAVSFEGTGGNLLALEHGYSFAGGITVAGSNNTLELRGDAGAVTVDLNKPGAGFTSFGTVAFGPASGNDEILRIDNTSGTVAATITGFAGSHDIIDLTKIGTDGTISSSDAINHRLTISGSGGSVTLQLDAGAAASFSTTSDGVTGTELIACYCRGTLIETPDGEIAVEALGIGDLVMTASGVARPVRWIGRRAYDGRFIAGNLHVLPIRIAAGALGEGVPARDLNVSPGHALYIDGVLVAAEHLVNGATIAQAEAVDRVEYFHIELETHDVIFAEGAPAETYVDCNNRMMFGNAAEYARLYPDDERPGWDFCATRHEREDAALTTIRARLLRRAEALGHTLASDPDLRLIVAGEIVRPEAVSPGLYRFIVPAGAIDVRLASRSSVPAEIDAQSRDVRRLGVPIERLVLRGDNRVIEARHNDEALIDGFHAAEPTHRWTDGLARIPSSMLRPFAGTCTLELHLALSGLAYRVDAVPDAAAA